MEFQIESQLSTEIANEPGEIARISDLLANAGIQINALAITEGTERGQFRFIADQPEDAQALLQENGLEVLNERVLSVRLSDQKGRLARITQAFAQAGINIDYVYASVDHAGASTRLVFKVENNALAARVLEEISSTPESARSLELV